jgi:hypothetical protein
MATAVAQRYKHPPILRSPADHVLERILREISVPADVLREAKHRRDLVCRLAELHEAASRSYFSGSIAHGTHNSPLGDADCGIVIDRRVEGFRFYGPDAQIGRQGPESFYQGFAAFIQPKLREAGYPAATLDLTGKRAIKFVFNELIEFDEFGPVDPYVDLIVALRRDEEPKGLWIPNRTTGWWDPANPERHTWLMTERDEKALSVFRAHVLRLGKRAVKRDGAGPGRIQAMCSWNLSALGLEIIRDRQPLAVGLAEFLSLASRSIAQGPTEDPAEVAGPIVLPEGSSCELAAERLNAMADVVWEAIGSRSEQGARATLEPLFAEELESIQSRETSEKFRSNPLHRALRSGEPTAVATALGAGVPLKRTASDGD